MSRAYGRILNSSGVPKFGDCYFYKIQDGTVADHCTIISKFGNPLVESIYGTYASVAKKENGEPVKASALNDKNRMGEFDVPGGLPDGTYFVDFHENGNANKRAWAFPLVVDGRLQIQDVFIGGIEVVPTANKKTVVLFGDSDTAPIGPKCRTVDLANLIKINNITVINRAEGATPIHGWLPDDNIENKKNRGIEQVERACREIPIIDFAICAFGLNDCHMTDMNPIVPSALAEIKNQYSAAIKTLQSKGAKVVLQKLILEGGNRSKEANKAFNELLSVIAKENKCTIFSLDIDALNDARHFVCTDGTHLNDEGQKYRASLIQNVILNLTKPIVIDNVVPEPSKQFTKGTFTVAFSAYGAGAADLNKFKEDASIMRGQGIGNYRMWVDWTGDKNKKIDNASCFDKYGNFIEPVAAKFDAILDHLYSIGSTADFTMHTAHYAFHDLGNEGYDIYGHLKALRNLLQRWGNHKALRIVDVANEAEARGVGNHGSPDVGHVSPARFAQLMSVARSIKRTCLVGVSISPGGEFNDVIKNHFCVLPNGDKSGIFRDTKGEVLLPHHSRVKGFGKNEGPQCIALMNKFPGIILHSQEPARDNYNGQNWPLSEYKDIIYSTAIHKDIGLAGVCHHTDAGFDLQQKNILARINENTRQFLSNLKFWLKDLKVY